MCVVQTTFAQILAEKIISANKDVIQTDEGAFMYHMRIKISDFFCLRQQCFETTYATEKLKTSLESFNIQVHKVCLRYFSL